jgi:chromodomain-helicase-DNA-binding protein 4
MQIGKKKMALDHVIVQKMDDNEDDTSMQSVLTFGAKALFEEGDQSSKDIICWSPTLPFTAALLISL